MFAETSVSATFEVPMLLTLVPPPCMPTLPRILMPIAPIVMTLVLLWTLTTSSTFLRLLNSMKILFLPYAV